VQTVLRLLQDELVQQWQKPRADGETSRTTHPYQWRLSNQAASRPRSASVLLLAARHVLRLAWRMTLRPPSCEPLELLPGPKSGRRRPLEDVRRWGILHREVEDDGPVCDVQAHIRSNCSEPAIELRDLRQGRRYDTSDEAVEAVRDV
jgi:hypothetical protein